MYSLGTLDVIEAKKSQGPRFFILVVLTVPRPPLRIKVIKRIQFIRITIRYQFRLLYGQIRDRLLYVYERDFDDLPNSAFNISTFIVVNVGSLIPHRTQTPPQNQNHKKNIVHQNQAADFD